MHLAAETISLDVNASDTIIKVKAKIQDIAGLLLHQVQLIFAGSQLKDCRTALD